MFNVGQLVQHRNPHSSNGVKMGRMAPWTVLSLTTSPRPYVTLANSKGQRFGIHSQWIRAVIDIPRPDIKSIVVSNGVIAEE